MKLVAGWRRVLKKAWSIRLILFSGFLSGLEVGLPYLGDSYPIPNGVFAGLSILVSVAAAVMRIISQKDFRDGE